MHLPYAHSSLTEDTYKNQVHLETLGGGGRASYLFILKVKGLTFFYAFSSVNICKSNINPLLRNLYYPDSII